MNCLIKYLLISSLLIASASPVYARHRGGENQYSDNRHHYARVVHVEPVYETISIAVPHQQCGHDRHHNRTGHHRSAAPAIIGGIIGGVIGNQFGGGSGKTAATIAGALLGGAIAHDVSSDSNHGVHRNRHDRHFSGHGSHSYRRSHHRCETFYTYQYIEEIVGYRVTYRHHGRKYHARMDHRPGRRVRISRDGHLWP